MSRNLRRSYHPDLAEIIRLVKISTRAEVAGDKITAEAYMKHAQICVDALQTVLDSQAEKLLDLQKAVGKRRHIK